VEAQALAQKSLEEQNSMLQSVITDLEANVRSLRLLAADRQLPTELHDPLDVAPSSCDAAVIFQLESRAKESELRAESMMFQKDEAEARLGLSLFVLQ
jgi:hypothetical protein